jgi:hypothetical protein
MYLGDQIQLVASLPSIGNVMVREQRTSADPAIEAIHPGEEVNLSWDEDAPLLLSEATPASPGGQEES